MEEIIAICAWGGSLVGMSDLPLQHLAGMMPAELEEWFLAAGEPAFRVRQVLDWVFGKRVFAFEGMKNLPAALRGRLSRGLSVALPETVRVQGSGDSTQKFLLRLGDSQLIETVLIPASPALYGERSDRRTLCVSSQVGCAYGCRFCASGLDGWKRNLSAAEIVGQWLAVEAATGERVSNLVFMGMGEPFANFANVMRAVEILNAPWGGGVGARKITVSTSGLVPRIREFADQPLQVRLAVSLHAATDAVRDRLMPVNRKHPLGELFEACAYFSERKKQRITFEYILIAGVNDSPEQARLLVGHARRLRSKINLIPYNEVPGLDWQRPSEQALETFLNILREAGIPATLRREKGHDIAAACGQLRLQENKKNAGAEAPAFFTVDTKTRLT